ncbi:hypothetical protein [Streptomyces paludis]|uniref:Uncharacterized protein n=1 Tax=Streptomyces paludis TaxID=2282738 RepID=A0A345HWP6_9ACTN|nr:hypothetical protein [Streptomyces paludis]AXG81120.1 hypothetical protein DVK44_29400 [Streptomyces paludis]
MSTNMKPPGRLLGGLLYARGRLSDWLDLHGPALRNIGWSAAGGVIGAAIGLLFVTAWLRWR